MKALSIIKTALKEDIGRGDITSQLIILHKKRVKATILAKENGVVCGLNIAQSVFKVVDKKISFKFKARYGQKVKRGQILAYLTGNAQNILKAERVALNFLGHLSGIATLTNQFVQRVKPYPVKIMDTRKTTPGLRMLEKYAVRCGGGFNHRMGLWDEILIKDNHLNSLKFKVKSLKLKEIIDKLRKNASGKKIEIEIKNLNQFKQALEAEPDIIMLDNMSIKNIRQAVKFRNQLRTANSELQTKLEVSGGVNLHNVHRIAATGVEMISVGELTHSAKALDVALNCE